jgi:hypothetical protein
LELEHLNTRNADNDKSLSVFKDPKVVRQWFNGEHIQLDGWHFVGCRFDNCSLTVSSPIILLERCLIDVSCKIFVKPSATSPIKIYNLRTIVLEGFSAFWPTYHEDGTISIGGNESGI